jgi:hypothetical protein
VPLAPGGSGRLRVAGFNHKTDLAAPAIIAPADGGRPGSADGLGLQAVGGELLVLDVETEHRDQCAGQEHARCDPER